MSYLSEKEKESLKDELSLFSHGSAEAWEIDINSLYIDIMDEVFDTQESADEFLQVMDHEKSSGRLETYQSLMDLVKTNWGIELPPRKQDVNEPMPDGEPHAQSGRSKPKASQPKDRQSKGDDNTMIGEESFLRMAEAHQKGEQKDLEDKEKAKAAYKELKERIGMEANIYSHILKMPTSLRRMKLSWQVAQARRNGSISPMTNESTLMPRFKREMKSNLAHISTQADNIQKLRMTNAPSDLIDRSKNDLKQSINESLLPLHYFAKMTKKNATKGSQKESINNLREISETLNDALSRSGLDQEMSPFKVKMQVFQTSLNRIVQAIAKMFERKGPKVSEFKKDTQDPKKHPPSSPSPS